METFDDAPGVDVGTKRVEFTGRKDFGQVAEFEGDPGVGLVRSVARHRLFVANAPERSLELHAGRGSTAGLGNFFEYLQHIFDTDEGHLEIDLGKFELPVGTQFFVAETARELVVAVTAPDHQQLLHDLWRLGERVKASGLQAGGHEKIPRTLGR